MSSSSASTIRDRYPTERVTIASGQPWKETNKKMREVLKADSWKPGFPFGEPVPPHPLAKDLDMESFARLVRKRLGPYELMLFDQFPHYFQIPMYLEKDPRSLPRTITYVIGNPLIALTMLQHDYNSGLHVPFRLAINEEADGSSSVTYVLPSSQIAIGQWADSDPKREKALRDAAVALDAKVEAMVRFATGTVAEEESVEARL
ncbi:hypothetical protein DL93DRAFT_2167320 [Clavulina sp. PMI_390]|nr:hypothetical protein DL93DRAFT_2167320 [Clavulina sp. PMI_390]